MLKPKWNYSYIRFEAVRSRGPGGQNVNKVSSAAIMYWDYKSDLAEAPDAMATIERKLATYIDREGFVYLRSDEFRDLPRNKERCLEKLNQILTSAFHRPKPRKATAPTRSSVKRRLESKTKKSENKKLRAKVRL